MSFVERNGSQAAAVGAGEISLDRQTTFFIIRLPLARSCTEILFRSAKYSLVGCWQNGKLTGIEGQNGHKPKRLEEDPYNGNLRIVGFVSDDGRIYLHQDLVAKGNRELSEAYCRELVEKYLDG